MSTYSSTHRGHNITTHSESSGFQTYYRLVIPVYIPFLLFWNKHVNVYTTCLSYQCILAGLRAGSWCLQFHTSTEGVLTKPQPRTLTQPHLHMDPVRIMTSWIWGLPYNGTRLGRTLVGEWRHFVHEEKEHHGRQDGKRTLTRFLVFTPSCGSPSLSAGAVCNLVLTNWRWQKWWDVIVWLLTLRKAPSRRQARSLSPCWLGRIQLPNHSCKALNATPNHAEGSGAVGQWMLA